MPQDYSEEKKPNIKMLLPEGWRVFHIIACSNEVQSKKGNPQYIVHISDAKTKYEENIYLINVKGKRWMLKSMCEACDVPKGEGGFLFESPEPPPILGKSILGLVIHEPNEYINKNAETIKTTQHKIVDFKKIKPKTDNPDGVTNIDEVAWEE